MRDVGRGTRSETPLRAPLHVGDAPLVALVREHVAAPDWCRVEIARGRSVLGYNRGAHTFVLADGMVKVWSISRAGNEVICAIAEAGDVLEALLSDDPQGRAWNITALTDCGLLRVRSSAFSTLLAGNAAASAAWVGSARRQYARLRDRLFEFGAFDARARVASILLDIAHRLHADVTAEPEFDLPVTRVELAAVCGISREALSKALRELRFEHDITLTGRHVCIHDAARLPDLAEWRRSASGVM